MNGIRDFLSTRLRVRAWVAGVAVVLVCAAAYLVILSTHDDEMTITAKFNQTPGLYAGGRVTILGVAVGKITSIKAEPGDVLVTMQVPKNTAIPADVHAIIDAPNPVSERTIDLYPAYASGPKLAAGAVIDLSHTNEPLGIDDILGDLNRLATTLGPSDSHRSGTLNTFVTQAAALADGLGPSLRTTLHSVAQILPGIAGNPGQVQRLITSLNALTTALANHDSDLAATLSSLKAVTGAAAANSSTLGKAISGLNGALGELNSFVQKNQGKLTTSLRNLATTTSALVSDQQALLTTFRVAPLGFENFSNIIDPTSPCVGSKGTCPVGFLRLILATNSAPLTNAHCESLAATLLKFAPTLPGISQLHLKSATLTDADCLAQRGVYDGHNNQTPGAPNVPDLELARYLK